MKLAWAFILVALLALVLAFVGLNAGLYASMMGMHQAHMISHGEMLTSQDFGSTLRWSLFSSLAAFVLAGATGWWTAGRITRSLTHLRDAARRADLRGLSLRVPVEGTDEIADVAAAFNHMGERLEAEERSRRQLLADTAHELRHPLAVLQGRLELMQDGLVPLNQEALLPLQDEVIRLTRLVGDLRDLSLAEVGGLSLQLKSVDAGALLETLLGNLEAVAAAREIRLRAEVAPDLPPVQADPDRIRQVFVNLLSNALQYTAPGGEVTLRAWHRGGQVHLRFCDTGPGIAPTDLPHIFDRFYRADKSRTRATGGSGLGLAIVRSLVELHHGTVTVDSQLGAGTCFTVVLPVQPAAGGRQDA